MPSSLLGCASQFVSGLYPTYRPYIYIYINEYMSLSYIQMSNYVYIYICLCQIHIYIHHTHIYNIKCVSLCRVWLLPGHPKSPACLPRVMLPERCGAWKCCHKRGSPHIYIYIYLCVSACVCLMMSEYTQYIIYAIYYLYIYMYDMYYIWTNYGSPEVKQ